MQWITHWCTKLDMLGSIPIWDYFFFKFNILPVFTTNTFQFNIMMYVGILYEYTVYMRADIQLLFCNRRVRGQMSVYVYVYCIVCTKSRLNATTGVPYVCLFVDIGSPCVKPLITLTLFSLYCEQQSYVANCSKLYFNTIRQSLDLMYLECSP